MGCLSADAVLAFVEGRLGPEGVAELEAHTAGCAACLDLLVIATSEGDRVGPDGTLPSPHIRLQWARPVTDPLPHGTAVGRYLLIALLGRGGMGEIYAAYDPELDRRIAIKLLNVEPESGGTPAEARTRLLREAKAIARLSHPNVVVVFDAGSFGERLFIAMELVEGETLSSWLQARPRSWREVRDVFVAAGRGLAAAHAAGLVHRDFKPQNVMVGRDGEARVTDFGLVRGLTSDGDPAAPEGLGAASSASADSGALGATLTRTGALVGTPLYMAPEQFRLERADARSDQFSYSVALYEGLYGERPFAGDSITSLRDAVVAGRLREPPANRGVPAWLRRVVLRGLCTDREARYPAMEAMIEALERDPMRQRRRLLLGGAVVAVVAAAALFGPRPAKHAPPMCAGAADKLVGIWEPQLASESPPRRGAIRRAFLGTDRGYSAETWDRVASGLDRYASRWRAAYTNSCEATHVRGEQSAEVLDLRMSCLQESLAQLKALTDIFATADAAVVAGAVDAVLALGRLERCDDVVLLRAIVPPPQDERTRASVTALRSRLAVVKALRDAGRQVEGLSAAVTLVNDAQALGYKPVLAEALDLLGWLQWSAGDFRASEQSLSEAVSAAEAGHHDEVKAEAAAMLGGVLGYELSRIDEGERWVRLAEATVERMGPGHERVLAWALTDRAAIHNRLGDFEAATRYSQQAIALKKRILEPDHPDLVHSLINLDIALTGRGDYTGALAANDQALAIIDRAYGGGTRFSAQCLGNRGETLSLLGRYSEARAAFEAALARWQEHLGPDHRNLAYPLTGLGQVQVATGQARAAVTTLERALRIREREEPDPLLVAETRFALARALWETGERARATTQASQARAALAALPRAAAKATAIDAWLRERAPVRAALR